MPQTNRKREIIMAKAKLEKVTSTLGNLVEQVTAAPTASVTEKSIQNAMKIKSLLESIGISITDEQADRLSTSLTVKGGKSRNKVTYFRGQVAVEPTTKLALQARIALECLQDGDTLEKWSEKLAADNRFVSKQSPATIISYYQKSLVDSGFLVKVI